MRRSLRLAACWAVFVWMGMGATGVDGATELEVVQPVSRIDSLQLVDPALYLSPDAQHVAYRVRNPQGQAVVIDGVEQAAHDSVCAPVFDSGGGRAAYAVRDGARWSLVADGKTVGVFDDVLRLRDLQFAPNGRRLLCVADGVRRQWLVVDGQRQTAHEAITAGSVTFSPDSRHVACAARDGEHASVVVDGAAQAPFDAVGSPRFSPDGRRVAYDATRGRRRFVVWGGREGRGYDDVSSPQFSPRGSRIFYTATTDSGVRVVVDGVENPLYRVVHSIVASGDGSHFAYAAQTYRAGPDGFDQLVVQDGRQGARYETVVEGSLVLSPDGTRLAYEAEIHDEFFAVVNGVAGKHYLDVINGSLQFSEDGRHVAYGADVGGPRLVVRDSTETGTVDDVFTVRLDPDGRHVAYVARDHGHARVFVDDTSGEAWDDVLGDLIVLGPVGRLHYLARRQGRLYRVERRLEP